MKKNKETLKTNSKIMIGLFSFLGIMMIATLAITNFTGKGTQAATTVTTSDYNATNYIAWGWVCSPHKKSDGTITQGMQDCTCSGTVKNDNTCVTSTSTPTPTSTSGCGSLACIGLSGQTCSITNGIGKYGVCCDCIVQSCNTGYRISGNGCVAITPTPSSSEEQKTCYCETVVNGVHCSKSQGSKTKASCDAMSGLSGCDVARWGSTTLPACVTSTSTPDMDCIGKKNVADSLAAEACGGNNTNYYQIYVYNVDGEACYKYKCKQICCKHSAGGGAIYAYMDKPACNSYGTEVDKSYCEPSPSPTSTSTVTPTYSPVPPTNPPVTNPPSDKTPTPSPTPTPSATTNPTATTDGTKSCYVCRASGSAKYVWATSAANAAAATKMSASNCSVTSDSYCEGTVVSNCYECNGKHVIATSDAEARSKTGESNCTIVTSDRCNSDSNPKTGTFGIVIAWIIGIMTIGYTMWYYKKSSAIN